MTLRVFPVLPGLTFTSLKSPKSNVLVESAPNGYEADLPQTVNPLWQWELIFDFLRDFGAGGYATVTELRTLMGFFNWAKATGCAFLYTDPDDNYVGPALASSAPNAPLAQLQLVSDGVGNYYSPVQRTLDGVFFEDIVDLNGGIEVYLDGTLATAGTGANEYTLEGPGLAIAGASWMGMVLKWGPGAPSWAASHTYALNAEIIDPAGHIQKAAAAAWAALAGVALGYEIVDPAGHIQKVTTAGTTGATIPTFNDSGGTTSDGTGGTTAVWTDQGSAGGNAGVSGTTQPSFNDTGGATPDGMGTLLWEDQGYYPGPAAPVTAQFNFYFRVRFQSASLDFEKFAGVGAAPVPAGQGGGFWTIGGSESQNGSGQLILRSARPVAL